MISNVYFFASFGCLDQLPAGGGQTAARRLWHTLEDLNFNVEITNRHRYYQYKGIIGKLLITFWAVLDPIIFFFKLLFKPRKNSVVLFMTYAGSLIMFDYLITLAAKLSGHKLVMYLAGGQALPMYKNGSKIRRWFYKHTWVKYDLIMCEGEISQTLVNEVTGGKVETFYLPNFTENGFAPDTFPCKPNDMVNIIYFGRLSSKKNILLSIDVFNILAQKYNYVTFTIVGGGLPEYVDKVKQAVNNSIHKDRLHLVGKCNHNELIKLMRDKHIFLFPSNEPCEGHSNALNEAMSWGGVPVVSSNNYLPSIVGNKMLVVDGFDIDKYVDVISVLIDEKLLPKLSREMFQRVRDNFTQEVVGARLKLRLKSL